MKLIPGKFKIAKPDLTMEEVEGYLVGGFGVHNTAIFCEVEEIEYTAWTVTHLGSGWRIGSYDDFINAKNLALLVNKNEDWGLAKCHKDKVIHIPESCRLQVQEFNRTRSMG